MFLVRVAVLSGVVWSVEHVSCSSDAGGYLYGLDLDIVVSAAVEVMRGQEVGGALEFMRRPCLQLWFSYHHAVLLTSGVAFSAGETSDIMRVAFFHKRYPYRVTSQIFERRHFFYLS